ncbi:MAG: T9SS type A sorting domain-containing protein [Tannerella sp.]|jgi:hypothetical protein|nr:T9SS type A sorting domain-containing protein [Tannerella sp.]
MKKVLLTVLGLMSVLGLAAQWNPQEELRLTDERALDFEAQTNKDNITFVAFWKMVDEDPEKQGNRYSEGIDIAYFLQIVTKDGEKLFPDEGKLVSHEPTRSFTYGDDRAIMTDNEGNVIYIVKDERNAQSGTSEGYFVYKLSPTGEFLWDEPVDLDKGNAYELVANIKMIELPDGSYLFAHDIYPDGRRSYIAIDKVSKTGEFVWDQPLLLTDNQISFGFPYLVDAGFGDFILVYTKGAGNYICAQKFDFEKEPVWSSEISIYTGGFTVSPHLVIEVISDQRGGAIVGWYDDRYNTKYEQAYVVHVLPNGTKGFVNDGGEGFRLNYNEGMRSFRPYLSYDPEGEILYAAWSEQNFNQAYRSVIVQKVLKDGTLSWSSQTEYDNQTVDLMGWYIDSGWPPEETGFYSIQLAGQGKIIVFHQHDYGAGNFTANIATLLNTAGNGEHPEYIWEEKQRVFSPQQGTRVDLRTSALIDNEYYLAFWMSRGGVYAKKVLLDLPVSIQAPATGGNLLSIVSDKTNDEVKFIANSPAAGNASLDVYSVSGQIAAKLHFQVQAGETVIPWSTQKLSAGVYIARLTTPNGTQVKRFIVQ